MPGLEGNSWGSGMVFRCVYAIAWPKDGVVIEWTGVFVDREGIGKYILELGSTKVLIIILGKGGIWC